MKTLIAFFFAASSLLSMSAHADEPVTDELNVLCVAKPGATAQQLYESCAANVVEQLCPAGFNVVNHIKNVSRPPFFLAATITCKAAGQGTNPAKGMRM